MNLLVCHLKLKLTSNAVQIILANTHERTVEHSNLIR